MKPLGHQDLEQVTTLASSIYDHADPERYPEFRVGSDINAEKNREQFFSMFMLTPEYADFNQRRAFGVYDSEGIMIAAVGVRRYSHTPSWSLSWLLSPSLGARFIPLFRFIVNELCQIHERAGMNEFYVTYPAEREEAYSRIMLFMRERYFTFVECTLPAKTQSHYSLIRELMGFTVHPHDMNFRRYILRRSDMEPASEGGRAKRKKKVDEDESTSTMAGIPA